MNSRAAVVSSGEQIEITIDSLNHNGEGVGRYKGVAVFVPFTIPGEKVLVEILELKKNYVTAKLIRHHEPSGQRIQPRCPVFDTCGGSQFQHIDYQLQLDLKRRLVEDALRRIGKITGVRVDEPLGMKDPWAYRNKAQFQVSLVDGKVKLGFFEEGSHALVPTTQCLLIDQQISDIAAIVEGILNKYQVPVYEWETGTGLLRHVVIRKGWATSKVMVVLTTSGEKYGELFSLAREIKTKVPQVVSVVRNINTSPNRTVFGRENQVLAGQLNITDQLAGLTFSISPTSFYQVNSAQTEILYAKALEFAGLSGRETVLDVYCGIGTISLFLARQAARVFGFEVSVEAVRDAAENAKANKIYNVEFISGKAEERLPKLVAAGVKPDVVVVDPPRQGIEKRALQAIADMAPERIVYISCNPATMARDLNFLSYRGYEVKKVQPVDMFPQTGHVESIVLMTNCGLKGE